MKRFFISIVAVSIVIGCSTETDVDFVKEDTFVRYYGTQQNDVAVLALEDLNGGYTLLSTSEIETAVTGVVKYRMHLTRLDEWGNLMWHHTYLESINTTASSFVQTDAGYFIIGDRIKSDATTDLQLLHVSSTDGTLIDEKTISLGSRSLHGKAIAAEGSSNFIVLGTIEGSSNDMYVAKIAATDLATPLWTREHGDGPAQLISRVYAQNNENIWGGSVLFNTSYDFRLVRAAEDSQVPFVNTPIGSPDFNENAVDFCLGISGWVITGYTNASFTKTLKDNTQINVNPNNTEDLYIMKITDNSVKMFYTQLEGQGAAEKRDAGDNSGDLRNDRGNSVCLTTDHSYIVLGTVETDASKEDLMVTKINDSGVEMWDRKYFGGADKQEGASVRELSDGSILVFGTTYFGTEKKLILLKLDKNGNL
jgi:hypothetical protein